MVWEWEEVANEIGGVDGKVGGNRLSSPDGHGRRAATAQKHKAMLRNPTLQIHSLNRDWMAVVPRRCGETKASSLAALAPGFAAAAERRVRSGRGVAKSGCMGGDRDISKIV